MAVLQAGAQNNPYELDDQCYDLYVKAEQLAGKDGFAQANEALMEEALAKQDKKAQVFYYVCKLKDVTRRRLQVSPNASPEEIAEARSRKNKEVLAAHEELKAVSRASGYMQYFFYSYSLAKNYFYNNHMQFQAVDLVKEMREIAIAEDNAYGKWFAAKEMASIYEVLRDVKTTRKYINMLIDEYEHTSDPTIRRQSLSSFYLDLAETYSAGSDSSRFYIDKAVSFSPSTFRDTVRAELAYARYYAARGDRAMYQHYRDIVIEDPNLNNAYAGGVTLLKCIDCAFAGTLEQNWDLLRKIPVRRYKIIAKVCESCGDLRLANRLKDMYIEDTENFFTTMNELHLEEMEARMGNARLQADLARKNRQVEYITTVVSVLLVMILFVVVLSLMQNVRHLKLTNEKVRKADEAKTRFVQNMSHEVRTPLNAIVGFSQLLSLPDGSFPPDEKEQFAEHIVNNTKMLTMLLDDILNASAMDKGSYRINYSEGECSFICRSSRSSSEHRLQSGVTMKYAVPDDLKLEFRTDPQRVQQILVNLLTNACKHTPSGEIRLGWTENGKEVSFYVEDTGPGVPAEKAEAIFDRFTKLNDFVQGTGLGLSICREIAGKMGGRVYLDTEYTDGARFVFVLPLE